MWRANRPIVAGVAEEANASGTSEKKKPRQAVPTGVDGGQLALAVGFWRRELDVSPAWKQQIAPVGGRHAVAPLGRLVPVSKTGL